MHNTFHYRQGNRDMPDPAGFTTKYLVDKFAQRLHRCSLKQFNDLPLMLVEPEREHCRHCNVDNEK